MTTALSRWRVRRLDDDEGLSLVEMMIALMIMGIALLAVASVAASALVQVRNSRTRQQATDAASAMIENLRLRDFSAIAMDATDPAVQALAGCGGAFDEPTVETNIAANAIPHEQVFPAGGPITVRTIVTWYDEGDDQACTAADHDRLSKRVTAIATWTDAGALRQVEQSTLVSQVERGLPAPDFRLGTPNVSINFELAEVQNDPENDGWGEETCVGHVLRNLGAQDSYDWQLAREDNGSVIKQNKSEFRTADGKWSVRAFMEAPAQATPLDPSQYGIPLSTQIADPTGLPDEVELMVDDDSNNAPESDARIDSGEQARIWICYSPKKDLSTGTSIAFEITVRSRFDPNETEVIEHDVTVTQTQMILWLFDDYAGATAGGDSTRVVDGQGNTKKLPTLTMGPTTLLQPERLDTTSSISDHDTDIDPDDLPGVLLDDRNYTYSTPSGSTTEAMNTSMIRWHEQFTEATTLRSTATLYLYLSTTDMLERDADDPLPDRTVALRIAVHVVDKQENNVVSTLYQTATSTPYVYTHWAERAYQLRTIPLTLATPVLERDQYLRLELDCLGVTVAGVPINDDCHLAYDHNLTPSRLVVSVLR